MQSPLPLSLSEIQKELECKMRAVNLHLSLSQSLNNLLHCRPLPRRPHLPGVRQLHGLPRALGHRLPGGGGGLQARPRPRSLGQAPPQLRRQRDSQ